MNIIEVKNLLYIIGGKKILDNVNATFEAGKITAIIGANGSGKSTLMSFLSKTRRSSNAVYFNGQDVEKIPAENYALRVAVLPQRSKMIADFRVEDVVVMGRFPYKKKFRDYTAEDRVIRRQRTGRSILPDKIFLRCWRKRRLPFRLSCLTEIGHQIQYLHGGKTHLPEK